MALLSKMCYTKTVCQKFVTERMYPMKGFSRSNRIFILITALLSVAAIACPFLICIKYPKNELQKADYQKIASTEYDTVFLSMYPIDTYREEDYSYYRGMTLFKSTYCIPSLSVLKDYMQRISGSGNHVTTAYLGIRPELADPRELQELLSRYPDINFEVILPYPSAEYWQTLSPQTYDETLTALCDFLTAAPDIPEANFYFFGSQEWLIANPGNYENLWSVNRDTAKMIMTHSDRDHGYLVTAENAAASAAALTSLTHAFRTSFRMYPDLSDHCIVFFGDSVIGNYTDSTSIPGVVSGLTRAEVYNCGYGGNSATMAPDIEISLPGIVDAFFRKDLSVLPKDTQVYAGIASYLEKDPSDRQLCFVINYGLNDYFCGYPVSSEDPYDITTFSGAVRTAVSLIQKNAPDARIILCTPNFVAAFENGMEPHGDENLVLTDYVDAILSLSQELHTEVLDNYHRLGITSENEGQYLADQIHPNSSCCYMIGSSLSRMIAEGSADQELSVP